MYIVCLCGHVYVVCFMWSCVYSMFYVVMGLYRERSAPRNRSSCTQQCFTWWRATMKGKGCRGRGWARWRQERGGCSVRSSVQMLLWPSVHSEDKDQASYERPSDLSRRRSDSSSDMLWNMEEMCDQPETFLLLYCSQIPCKVLRMPSYKTLGILFWALSYEWVKTTLLYPSWGSCAQCICMAATITKWYDGYKSPYGYKAGSS